MSKELPLRQPSDWTVQDVLKTPRTLAAFAFDRGGRILLEGEYIILGETPADDMIGYTEESAAAAPTAPPASIFPQTTLRLWE